jgi:hypothetical protein
MRLLIVLWLLISLAATGVFTYRHHHRRSGSETAITRDMEAARPSASGGASHNFAAREPARAYRAPRRESNGEQLALMVSIASSVISAIAALAQTWLTHRAMKGVRPGL